MVEKKIKARLIIEIVGMPEAHVAQTIILLGEKFAAGDPEVNVLSKKVREPIQLPNSSLYSAFIEFEIEVASLATLLGLIYDYMPSSIEILEPEQITESLQNLNALLNDLAAKLHSYDATIKELVAKLTLAKKGQKEEKS
ncbi:MAG: hypothetical protein ACPLYW_02900 [Candidatus Nanoarchaeia archaeon]